LHEFVLTMIQQWKEVYPYCDFVIDTTHSGALQIVDMITGKLKHDNVQFASRQERESST
jgi:shikimate kinase